MCPLKAWGACLYFVVEKCTAKKTIQYWIENGTLTF